MSRPKTLLVVMLTIILVGGILGGIEFYRRLRFAQRTSCVGNLVRLNLAKLVYTEEHGLTNGSMIPPQVIFTNIALRPPLCRMGGTYSVNAVGTTPTCSYTGTIRWKAMTWKHSLERP